MSRLLRYLLAGMFALFSFTFFTGAGCNEEEPPLEEAGEEVEQAADEIEEEADEAADELQ